MGSKRSGTDSAGRRRFASAGGRARNDGVAVAQRHRPVREAERDGPPPLRRDLAEARAGPDGRAALRGGARSAGSTRSGPRPCRATRSRADPGRIMRRSARPRRRAEADSTGVFSTATVSGSIRVSRIGRSPTTAPMGRSGSGRARRRRRGRSAAPKPGGRRAGESQDQGDRPTRLSAPVRASKIGRPSGSGSIQSPRAPIRSRKASARRLAVRRTWVPLSWAKPSGGVTVRQRPPACGAPSWRWTSWPAATARTAAARPGDPGPDDVDAAGHVAGLMARRRSCSRSTVLRRRRPLRSAQPRAWRRWKMRR